VFRVNAKGAYKGILWMQNTGYILGLAVEC
jgi:hypothetical protein